MLPCYLGVCRKCMFDLGTAIFRPMEGKVQKLNVMTTPISCLAPLHLASSSSAAKVQKGPIRPRARNSAKKSKTKKFFREPTTALQTIDLLPGDQKSWQQSFKVLWLVGEKVKLWVSGRNSKERGFWISSFWRRNQLLEKNAKSAKSKNFL